MERIGICSAINDCAAPGQDDGIISGSAIKRIDPASTIDGVGTIKTINCLTLY